MNMSLLQEINQITTLEGLFDAIDKMILNEADIQWNQQEVDKTLNRAGYSNKEQARKAAVNTPTGFQEKETRIREETPTPLDFVLTDANKPVTHMVLSIGKWDDKKQGYHIEAISRENAMNQKRETVEMIVVPVKNDRGQVVTNPVKTTRGSILALLNTKYAELAKYLSNKIPRKNDISKMYVIKKG
jgi:hypothetical protein